MENGSGVPVKRFLRGLLLLGVAFLADVAEGATPPACGILRALFAYERDSQWLLATRERSQSLELAKRLDARLNRLMPYAMELATSRLSAAASTHRELGASVLDFIASRRQLLDIHRWQGSQAAVDLAATGFYRERWQALRDAWSTETECAEEGGRGDSGQPAPVRPLRAGTPQTIPEGRLQALVKPLEAAGLMEDGQPTRIAIPLATLALVALGVMAFAAWNPRRERRYPCNLPARLCARALMSRGHIVDISRRGAKFAVQEHTFRPGQTGDLRMGGMKLEIRIIWANASFVGVKFRRRLEISPRALAEISDRLNGPSPPGLKKGLSTGPKTA